MKKGDKYRHWRGYEYEIIGVRRHSESLEELVVYTDGSHIWIRPKSMWEDIIPGSTGIKRFTKVE